MNCILSIANPQTGVRFEPRPNQKEIQQAKAEDLKIVQNLHRLLRQLPLVKGDCNRQACLLLQKVKPLLAGLPQESSHVASIDQAVEGFLAYQKEIEEELQIVKDALSRNPNFSESLKQDLLNQIQQAIDLSSLRVGSACSSKMEIETHLFACLQTLQSSRDLTVRIHNELKAISPKLAQTQKSDAEKEMQKILELAQEIEARAQEIANQQPLALLKDKRKPNLIEPALILATYALLPLACFALSAASFLVSVVYAIPFATKLSAELAALTPVEVMIHFLSTLGLALVLAALVVVVAYAGPILLGVIFAGLGVALSVRLVFLCKNLKTWIANEKDLFKLNPKVYSFRPLEGFQDNYNIDLLKDLKRRYELLAAAVKSGGVLSAQEMKVRGNELLALATNLYAKKIINK